MAEWIQKNAWSILIAGIGVATTFSVYGYRIEQVEKEIAMTKTEIEIINQQQVQAQVQLAQIAVDISYIKASIDRILR